LKRAYANTFWLVIVMFVAGGCTTVGSDALPSINAQPSNAHRTGSFVWFDLLSEDVDAARAFYRDLFGWRIQPTDDDGTYLMIHNGSRAIGGIVAHENRAPQAVESLWIGSLSVEDVDRAAAAVRNHGGTVLEGPLNAMPRGRMALFADPAGAVLALLRTHSGDPADAPPGEGDWLWTDLIIDDAGPVKDFYYPVAGFTLRALEDREQHSYSVFMAGRQPRAGMVVLDWEGIEANWLPYVRVMDLAATIASARRLGGRLLIEHDDVAVLLDPTGAAFGIQELAKEGA
jgi:predicted enzyme related to lactoylglutathione lyase